MSRGMAPARVTVAVLAALAFGVACFTHEVLGHAGACLAQGGVVTRLSSVYFHCRGGGMAVDLGGPGANLVAAALLLALLRARRWHAVARAGLALAAAFNLFWVSGCLLASALAATSDFALAVRSIGGAEIPLRAMLCAAGVGVGVLTRRMLGRQALSPGALRLAYGVAGITPCVVVLCFAGPLAPALRAAALEGFGAMAWLLAVRPKNPFR